MESERVIVVAGALANKRKTGMVSSEMWLEDGGSFAGVEVELSRNWMEIDNRQSGQNTL